MRSAMALNPNPAQGSCGLLRFAAAVLLLIQAATAGITSLEVPRACDRSGPARKSAGRLPDQRRYSSQRIAQRAAAWWFYN